MRRLKRTLAVALVLVMALGMMPFGSALTTSKDYTDAASINNKEAVDVLSAIDVMEGVEGDSGRHFSPGREVNRAEAAAIIARLLLGRKVADSLPTSTTIFRDVPASHWASGYINWCVSQDIVQGYPDGRYGPRNNVKASEFAVMLLRALGWGRQGEYTGAMWETNAIVDAMREGIFAGVGAINFSGAANREQTALYAFNALTAEFMVWSRDTESYIEADRDSSKENSIRTRMYSNPLLSYKTGVPDPFKRPSKVWTLGDDTIGTYVSKANLTFTAGIQQRDIWRGLGLRGDDWATTLFIDGSSGTAFPIEDVTTAISQTGRGVLTEVYHYWVPPVPATSTTPAVDGYWQTDVIIIYTYLAQVIKVKDASGDDPRTIDLEVFGTMTSLKKATIVGYATNSYEEDDWLLLNITTNYAAADNIKIVKTAPSFEDQTISSFSKDTNVSFGGTTYRYSANMNTNEFDIEEFFFSPASYNFFMDGYGNIIGHEQYKEADTPLNYAYVSDARFVSGVGSGLNAQGYTAKVELTFLDGTREVFDVKLETAGATAVKYADGSTDTRQGDLFINFPKDDGTPRRFFVAGAVDPGYANKIDSLTVMNTPEETGPPPVPEVVSWWNTGSNRLISYELDDGKVKISHRLELAKRNAELVLGTALEFKANQPNVGITGIFANRSTTLVSRAADGTIAKYDGFANFPAWEPKAVPVVYVFSGTAISDILVVGDSVPAVVSPDGYAFYTGNARSVSGGTEYQLFVNGALAWHRVASSTASHPGKGIVYSFALNESNNTATLVDVGIPFTVQSVSNVSSNFLVFETDNPSNMFADDMKVYNVTSSTVTNWAATTASGIAAKDDVLIVETGTTTKTIVAIFIINRPPPA